MTDVERRARKLCAHPAPRNDSVDIACDRCRFIESIIRSERRHAVRRNNSHREEAVNRETFIDAFVVAFLATWVANNYDNACARGEHSRLNNPPAEDALGLAEAAWKKLESSR